MHLATPSWSCRSFDAIVATLLAEGHAETRYEAEDLAARALAGKTG